MPQSNTSQILNASPTNKPTPENPYKHRPPSSTTKNIPDEHKYRPNNAALSCATLKNIKKIRDKLSLPSTPEVKLPVKDVKQVKQNIKQKITRNRPAHVQ